MKYKIAEGYIIRNILDECVIVPIGRLMDTQGGFIALNESGKLVFEGIRDGASEDDIAKKLCEEYEIEEDQAKSDVKDFIKSFTEMGIVTAEEE